MENENSNTQIAPVDNALTGSEEFLDALLQKASKENLKKKKRTISLTSEYLNLSKEGEQFRGVFIGYGTARFKNENPKAGEDEYVEQETVRLLNDGKQYIHSSWHLVKQFQQNSIAPGTMIEVTYVKKDGRSKIFEVTILG